jgi:dihydrofolate reductase
MRKVIVSEFVSLDGVIEAPEWATQFGDEENAYKMEELFACDALLLGRVTYQEFAAVWPGMAADTGEYGERMNNLPKYVVSTTLQEMEWNASLIQGNITEEIYRLKQQSGQDLLVFGSGELVHSLTQHHLIDEYRLMTFPVVVGSGKRLFAEGSEKQALKLIEAKAFSSGVIVLSYQPIKQ